MTDSTDCKYNDYLFISVATCLFIVIVTPMIILIMPIINQAIQQDKENADSILDESIPLEQRCLHLHIADSTLDKGNLLAGKTLAAIEKLEPYCMDGLK